MNKGKPVGIGSFKYNLFLPDEEEGTEAIRLIDKLQCELARSLLNKYFS